MTGRLLTGRQVADTLGVSTATVLRWAREGKLPAIWLSNRAIRFPEDKLDTWLAERAAPGGAAPTTQPNTAPARLSSIGANHPTQRST